MFLSEMNSSVGVAIPMFLGGMISELFDIKNSYKNVF